MRRHILSLIALGVVLSLGTVCANAQTQITLGASGTDSVVFTGAGALNPTTVNLTLGTCSGSTCTLSGSASGPGTQTGTYTLTSTLGSITLTSSDVLMGQWNVSQTAAIGFTYANGGTTYLTGNLQLVNFAQTSGSATGTFDYSGTANLTITGGTLAGTFGGVGAVIVTDITMIFDSTTNISTLLGTNNTLKGKFSSGEVLGGTSAPVPEPSSMLLFGSGLLAIGSALRRRRSAVA